MEKVKLDKICEKYFGITTRRFRQLSNEGIVPAPENGLIDVLDACKGLISYYRELSEGGSDLAEARRQKVLVETELKKLQLLLEKKELIPRSEILGLFMTRLNQVKMGLIVLNRTLTPALYGVSVRQAMTLIKGACYQLLQLYSTPHAVFSHRLKLEIPESKYPGPPDEPYLRKENYEEKIKTIEERTPQTPTGISQKAEKGKSILEGGAKGLESPSLVPSNPAEYYTLGDLKNRLQVFDTEIIRRIFSKATGPGKVGVEAHGQADFLLDKTEFEKWWAGLSGRTDAEKINHFQRYE